MLTGKVTEHRITNDGLKYSVIEINEAVAPCTRLFVPGTDIRPGSRVTVTIAKIHGGKQ